MQVFSRNIFLRKILKSTWNHRFAKKILEILQENINVLFPAWWDFLQAFSDFV